MTPVLPLCIGLPVLSLPLLSSALAAQKFLWFTKFLRPSADAGDRLASPAMLNKMPGQADLVNRNFSILNF